MQINIKKRHLYILVGLIILATVGYVIAQTPGVSHHAAEITTGRFDRDRMPTDLMNCWDTPGTGNTVKVPDCNAPGWGCNEWVAVGFFEVNSNCHMWVSEWRDDKGAPIAITLRRDGNAIMAQWFDTTAEDNTLDYLEVCAYCWQTS